ncbi:hypothetical protein H6G00_00380 [Leptolyngbya sp. FACHB-541]|uniref:hypothetical protein n=1 Tax=Leptolyngbya sp. FACHB-541 TaxID=2692810 RepID=UPI0016823C93|nr:hypothetical protein [Leptolyngbya sp. FACHB-541]MBD1995085.1 hypothetical protein [Leptolyngbya sp. FACHB-541]
MKKIELDDVAISNIKVMSALGLSVASIASMLRDNLHIQISERTLWTLKKHNKKVREAFISGTARAEYDVGRALFEKASQGDLGAIRYFEATRLGRSEKLVQEVHHKGLPEQADSNVMIYIPHNNRDPLPPGYEAISESDLPVQKG